MKQTVEERKPSGLTDHVALAMTTWGVGYIPGAPGTYGSAIAVAIYIGVGSCITHCSSLLPASSAQSTVNAVIAFTLGTFCLVGIWASGRSIPLLGNEDPPEAVVDEVMGQLITFCFIPFGLDWPFILAGFLLFRLFDIWKPYPIDDLQVLPGGLGICADDIVAGVYAGICLAVSYAVYLAV
ncbi:phosphatidylglycerophosphatase A [soil metagenome]